MLISLLFFLTFRVKIRANELATGEALPASPGLELPLGPVRPLPSCLRGSPGRGTFCPHQPPRPAPSEQATPIPCTRGLFEMPTAVESEPGPASVCLCRPLRTSPGAKSRGGPSSASPHPPPHRGVSTSVETRVLSQN